MYSRSVRERTNRDDADDNDDSFSSKSAPVVEQVRRHQRHPVLDRLSVIAVAVAALMWASDTYFRASLVSDHLSSTEIVLAEDAVVVLLFLPLAPWILREVRTMEGVSWVAMVLVAAGPQAIATVLFTQSLSIALHANAAAETYVLQQLQPLIAVLLASVILRERPRPIFWPLSCLALAAVYTIVFANDPTRPLADIQHGQVTAAFFALGAGALWATGTVMGRVALARVSFVTTTALRFTLALPILLACVAVLDGRHALSAYRLTEVPAFVGLGLVPGFLALLLYYRGLASTPATLATFAETIYPVAVVILLALPPPYGFSQPIYPAQVVGVVILTGVLILFQRGKDRDIVSEPLPHELQPATSMPSAAGRAGRVP